MSYSYTAGQERAEAEAKLHDGTAYRIKYNSIQPQVNHRKQKFKKFLELHCTSDSNPDKLAKDGDVLHRPILSSIIQHKNTSL